MPCRGLQNKQNVSQEKLPVSWHLAHKYQRKTMQSFWTQDSVTSVWEHK